MNRGRLIRNLVLTCIVGGLVVAGAAAAISRITDDSPASSRVERGRWFNTTYPLKLRFTAAGGLHEVVLSIVTAGYDPPELFGIFSDPDTCGLVVDGRTGQVSEELYNPSDPVESAFIEALRGSLRYELFSPGSAPWPYVDREPFAGEGISEPDPLSGVHSASNFATEAGPATFYHNWRSYLVVSRKPDGDLEYFCEVHEADLEAFSRILSQFAQPGDKTWQSDNNGDPGCKLTP
jgi:hypothetical protein